MGVAAPKTEDELLPKDVARLALDACDNLIADATQWAVDWMSANPAWVARYQDEMARRWMLNHLHRAVNDQRHLATGGAPAHHAGNRAQENVVAFQSQLTATIADNYSRMMDAPLWGGKRIGDATPPEIRESAEQFAKSGKAMTRKANWQTAVADAAEKNGVGPTDKIRESLSERTLAKLWEESCVA